MGAGGISSVNAPANQDGHAAASSSADSAAQSKFAKAKQSAIAENTPNTQGSNNTQNSKDKTNSQQHASAAASGFNLAQRPGQVATTRTSTAGNAATNAASSPGGWTAPLQPSGGGPVGPFFSDDVQKSDVGGCHGGCQTSHHKTRQPKLEAPVIISTKPTQVTAESIKKWQTDGEAARKAQEEAEKADYEKVGRRIAPYGDTFTPPDELKELSKKKGFYDPWVDDNKNWGGFSGTYRTGDKLSGGYTVVSPQWGIVKRNVNGTEYFFRIGTDNMEKLKVSTHISENSTTAQDVYRNTKGVVVAYAYATKAVAWAAETFGGPLGGAAAPVLNTGADQGLQDLRRIDARLEGRDFNEKKIEVNSKTGIDSLVGAVSGPVGNKVSKSVQSAKVVANSAVKAKIASHVAEAAVSKQIAQAGEVAKSAIDGKGVSATDFVPSVGVGDAVGLVEGAVTGRVQKTWTGGRTPSAPKADGHAISSSSGRVEKPSAKPLPSQTPLSLQENAPQPQTGQAPPTSPPSGGGGGHGGGDHGGSDGGGPRKSDAQVDAAFDKWTKLDLETDEEARAKPDPQYGPVDRRPKAENDPLMDQSKGLRQRRDDLLAARDQARAKALAEGKTTDEADKIAAKMKAEPLPKGQGVRQYQADVRERMKAEAEAEVIRHEKAVLGQPAMTPRQLTDVAMATRGHAAGASVWEGDALQKEYDSVKAEIKAHPPAPELDTLQQKTKAARTDLEKLKRKDKSDDGHDNKRADDTKPSNLTEAEQQRKNDLEAEIAKNTAEIERHPLTKLHRRANGLHDRLAISGLVDPDAPGQKGKGALAGRGENTYAVLQIVGPDGKILALAPGQNSAERHAEQNAIIQLKAQLARRKEPLPSGSRLMVSGDQVVCTEICKPDLSKFAIDHGLESVDGYTRHAVKTDAEGGGVETAKTTARETTTEAAKDREVVIREVSIYKRGEGPHSANISEDSPPK